MLRVGTKRPFCSHLRPFTSSSRYINHQGDIFVAIKKLTFMPTENKDFSLRFTPFEMTGTGSNIHESLCLEEIKGGQHSGQDARPTSRPVECNRVALRFFGGFHGDSHLVTIHLITNSTHHGPWNYISFHWDPPCGHPSS